MFHDIGRYKCSVYATVRFQTRKVFSRGTAMDRNKPHRKFRSVALGILAVVIVPVALAQIGQEVAIPMHLQDGQEFQISIQSLIGFGQKLFGANWTIQEGGGRPLTKGTGAPLTDPTAPLVFPRNFNRMSAPDANSCAGCHNTPTAGGGGDRVSEVFVLGQRFDFLSFDHSDMIPTRGAVDEMGNFVTELTAFDERKTIGMNGSGYVEMLARQMTADLQALRNSTMLGGSTALMTKGVSFGTIKRNMDGTWDTSMVQGIPGPSLATTGSNDPPSLIIRPFHQVGNVVSIRQFTNNAFNHHHGIQSEERFGVGIDADGDGFVNELTRADVTAASIFQATLAVPGQVIPSDAATSTAIANGGNLFGQIGCAGCHIPALPLGNQGWIYSEPNPYNPAGNLRPSDGVSALTVNLNSPTLPQPRLRAHKGVVMVPAYTDLKLHDISSGPGDPNAEPLNQNAPGGSAKFFAGNTKFITRKLWGTANQGPFMHHGKFMTMREAVLAHSGEALASRQAFQALTSDQMNAVIEFLKSLQVLPPGTPCLVIDENGNCLNENQQ